MNAPHPSRWGELFDLALDIIDQANATSPVVRNWTIGGGTALMLQIDHRESHDVDVFVPDPQMLPYLNPETQDMHLRSIPDDYVSDGASMLKIVFEGMGEIDFISASSITDKPALAAIIRDRQVMLETPAEIIAKKIVYRGARIQPRDIFDIAAVAQAKGETYLIDALSPYPNECDIALKATRKIDAELTRTVMSRLMHREAFASLADEAHGEALHVLERVTLA